MNLVFANLAVSRFLIVAAIMMLLAACATSPKKDLALEQVKAQLKELQSDEELAGYAPLALGEAKGLCVRLRMQAVTRPSAFT